MRMRKILILAITGLIPLAATPAYTAQDNKSTSDQRNDLTRSSPDGGTIAGTATPTPQSSGTQGNGNQTTPRGR